MQEDLMKTALIIPFLAMMQEGIIALDKIIHFLARQLENELQAAVGIYVLDQNLGHLQLIVMCWIAYIST